MNEEYIKKIAENIAMVLRGKEIITPEEYYETRQIIYKELKGI